MLFRWGLKPRPPEEKARARPAKSSGVQTARFRKWALHELIPTAGAGRASGRKWSAFVLKGPDVKSTSGAPREEAGETRRGHSSAVPLQGRVRCRLGSWGSGRFRFLGWRWGIGRGVVRRGVVGGLFVGGADG